MRRERWHREASDEQTRLRLIEMLRDNQIGLDDFYRRMKEIEGNLSKGYQEDPPAEGEDYSQWIREFEHSYWDKDKRRTVAKRVKLTLLDAAKFLNRRRYQAKKGIASPYWYAPGDSGSLFIIARDAQEKESIIDLVESLRKKA